MFTKEDGANEFIREGAFCCILLREEGGWRGRERWREGERADSMIAMFRRGGCGANGRTEDRQIIRRVANGRVY